MGVEVDNAHLPVVVVRHHPGGRIGDRVVAEDERKAFRSRREDAPDLPGWLVAAFDGPGDAERIARIDAREMLERLDAETQVMKRPLGQVARRPDGRGPKRAPAGA
jgi:hypothetical protein